MGTVKGIGAVESVLFASGKSMEEGHIKELTNLKPKETRAALEALKETYDKRDTSLFIWNEGTKWKINVKEEHAALIRSLAAETELSRPILETLAIIAYRTPVLQSEIIHTRGDGAYAHIAELDEKGFLTKERFGRSYKIKITDKFYHYFDVEGGKDIREAFKDAKQPDIEKFAKEAEKKLGKLEVVEALTDEATIEKHRKETQLEIYTIKEQREDDKKNYLNGFEERLGKVSGRIDEAEKHILEQKKQLETENTEREDIEEDINKELEIKKQDQIEKIIQEEQEKSEPQKLVEDIEKQIEEITKEED